MDDPYIVIDDYHCACGVHIRLPGTGMGSYSTAHFYQHCSQDESRPVLPLLDELEHHGDFWLSQTGRWEVADENGNGVARFRELIEAERFRREALHDPDGAKFTIREQGC